MFASRLLFIAFASTAAAAAAAAAAALPAGAATAAAATTIAVPGADGPGAYSHVMPVTVSGKQAVVQLPLPRVVYLEARSRALRDLRLFDAAGTAMPFALVERPQLAQAHSTTAPVAVFALRAPAGATANPQDGLQIRTREDGTLVSVATPAARNAGDDLASLVLDMQPTAPRSAGKQAIAALVLGPPPGSDNYSARVLLESSDDLQRWEPVAEGALSWLSNSQGARVQRNRIAFEPHVFRYARLRWLEGKPVEFGGVSAEFVSQADAPQQWDSVVLQAAPGGAGDDLVYAAPLAAPVEAIGLVFQGQNVILPALLGRYRERLRNAPAFDKARGFEALVNTTFYQMTQDGRQRSSGDIAMAPTHASQWVLRPQAKVTEWPALRLRWKPATLVFVAGGTGPYTLAFGRADLQDTAQAAALPLDQVAPGFSRAELAALEVAKAGPAVQQHVRAEAPTSVMPGRGAWLWALLVIGVAMLGWMAWRLSRQLKEGASSNPPQP